MHDPDTIQNGRILIIDLSPEDPASLVWMIEEQGYTVQVRPNQPGISAAIQADPPDIILLNITGTDANSLAFCRELKATPQIGDIPILCLIAEADLSRRAEIFAAGGDDYLLRPFQPAEVLARLRTHIRIRHLQSDQQQFRVFFEHAPVGIGISQNGVTVAVNPAYVQMFGYTTSDELLGTPIIDCIAPQERAITLERVQRRMRSELVEQSYPLTCLRRDGTFFEALCVVSRVELRGRPCSAAFFTDITERKRAEDALRISEMRYRTIMQNFPNGSFYLFDHDLRYMLTQGAGMALVGLTSDMLEGKTIWEALDAETCAVLEPAYRAALAGETTSFEFTYHDQIFEVYTLPVFDDQQAIIAGVAVTRIITEYRKLEATLRASQARMQAILNSAAAGIIVFDQQGYFLEVNDRWQAMIGYSAEELSRLTPWDLSPDKDNVEGRRQFQRLLRGEIDHYRMEKRYIRRDGSLFWCEVSVTTICNEQQQIDMVLAVAIDISDRKQAEQEIRRLNSELEQRVLERTQELYQANQSLQAEISERQRAEASLREREATYRAMFEKNRAIKLLIEPETGKIVDANSSAAEFYGYPLDTLCTMHITDINILPVAQLRSEIMQAFSEKRQYFIFKHRLASGSIRDVEVYSGSLEIRGRTLIYSIVHDITERRRAEAALRQSEARFRLLAEHAPDIIFRYNLVPVRSYEYVSPSAERILGYTPQEFYANPDLLEQLLHHESASLYQAAYADPENYREPLIFRCTCRNGRAIWLEQLTWPIYTDDGAFIAVEGIARDITERKLAEQQLRHYADELQQRIIETRQFVYIVSHDLRSPLVNLKGFSAELVTAIDTIRPIFIQAMECVDSARRQEVLALINEDINESLTFITSAVTQMDHLINALLKLSRMGQRELDLQPVDLQDLVTTTLQTLAHQIAMRGAEITVEPLPEIIADQTAMEQIMGNILSNAILYLDPTRPGQITVRSEQRENSILIRIHDNGRGIAAEDMDKIFAPFRRAGKNDIPGEGMGLTYVQALVRRHGGQIRCTSEPGVGTTFTIWLPATPLPEAQRLL